MKINIEIGKKILESNNEDSKKIFMERFYSFDKSRSSKKLIKFIFHKMIENKIEYLNSLNEKEIENHSCVIKKSAQKGETEVIDFFILRRVKYVDFYNIKNLHIETIKYLEREGIKNLNVNFAKNIINNNSTDIVFYYLDNKIILAERLLLSKIIELGRCDLINLIFEKKGMFEDILSRYDVYHFINRNTMELISDEMLDIILDNKVFEMEKFNNWKISLSKLSHLNKFVCHGLIKKVKIISDVFIENFRELKKYQYDLDIVKKLLKKERYVNIKIYAACDNFLVDVEILKNYIIRYWEISRNFFLYRSEFCDLMKEIIAKYSKSERKEIIDFCNYYGWL